MCSKIWEKCKGRFNGRTHVDRHICNPCFRKCYAILQPTIIISGHDNTFTEYDTERGITVTVKMVKKRSLAGNCAVSVFVIALVTTFVAFCSPSWLVSDYRITGAKLDKIGLWTHCFRCVSRSPRKEREFSICFHFMCEFSPSGPVNRGKKFFFYSGKVFP